MKNSMIIKKMVVYIDKILNYCEGYTLKSFADDSKLLEACAFNLSQIGELVRHLDEEFMKENNSIPWRQIYGLRNRIVHDYEGVNLELVWEIINESMPSMRKQLKNMQ